MQVIKRDGRIVKYDGSRIQNAVYKAYMSVNKDTDDPEEVNHALEFSDQVAKRVEKKLSGIDHDINIEEIQDLVEKCLMASSRKDVARAYITYRNDRSKNREYRTEFMKIVRDKISASDIQNQNANVDEMSFGGRKGEASNELMKKYALDTIISQKSRENHIENKVYIHDLDSYAIGMHNCLSVPFDDLLANGFNTRQTDVRPARSVNTAFQLVAVLFQLQSLQQFGN